jgi:hypothetical protein
MEGVTAEKRCGGYKWVIFGPTFKGEKERHKIIFKFILKDYCIYKNFVTLSISFWDPEKLEGGPCQAEKEEKKRG